MFAVCLCKGTCLFVCSVLIQQTFMNMKHGERELQSDICQKSANSRTAQPFQTSVHRRRHTRSHRADVLTGADSTWTTAV